MMSETEGRFSNCFELVASLVEKETIRYSPAGVPILSISLLHKSRQVEAETERVIEFEIPAIAIGNSAHQFENIQPGVLYKFSGFMATKNRKSKNLLFHVTEIKFITI